MKKMMRRIAVYNHKGGIGKTTIAVHLAYYAEELKIRTFATCIDPQGDLWRWLSGGDAIQTSITRATSKRPCARFSAAGAAMPLAFMRETKSRPRSAVCSILPPADM